MNADELLQLYNELSALADLPQDEQAAEELRKRFFALPEDVQGELITRMYLKSLQDKVESDEAIAEIQERALEELDALDVAEQEIRKSNHEEN